MIFIVYILAFILILSVIIFIHELGHFIAAKRFGVFCGEFSIGMGPVLWKKQGKETQYSLRLFPVGGFVSIAGEKDDTKKEVEVPFARTINGIKSWQKIVIMAAGIVMNILLAFIILVALNMYTGSVAKPAEPIFEQVQNGSLAEEAGFENGDYVLSLTGANGKKIVPKTFDDIKGAINLTPQAYTFEVKREGKIVTIDITPEPDENGVYYMGVSTSIARKNIAWYEAFYYGAKDVVHSTSLITKSVVSLVEEQQFDQLSGPVGIYKVTGIAVDAGILTLLHLIALLSLNIGIFNAIPIPVLDGGRIVITILEKIFRKPINPRVLNIAMYGGMIFLIGLMLLATYNDVIRLF